MMLKKGFANMLSDRRSLLKEKMRSRKKVFGAWTSIGHPSITEIFARGGVDFIGIDIEHSTISQEQSQRIIAAAQAGGTKCLPRIASHNMEMIKRLLDSGADGIIVPMVQTLEEVNRLVSWVKYPPEGQRSFGISRGQGYGFDFEEYTSNWNEKSIIVVQIESVEGVNNIDSIIAVPHVDGAMIGPYDLSGSLGIPGQLEHPDIIEASRKVINACKRAEKACGTQLIEPDQARIAQSFKEGFSFVVLSSDIFVLWKWSASMQDLLKDYR